MKIQAYFNFIGVLILISGCSKFNYTPEEYEIDKGRISPLTLSGPASVSYEGNSGKKIVIKGEPGGVWYSSLNEISMAMASQLESEIFKNGHQLGTRQKSLNVHVFQFSSKPVINPAAPAPPIMAFILLYKTHVSMEVSGENNFRRYYKFDDISNAAISGSGVEHCFNSAIAVGVIRILRDESVREYLKN
jgi:hypothetical protein